MSLGTEFSVESEINYMVRYCQIQRQAKSRVWITKDGKKINVSDMTDQHLINTTKFIERNNVNDLYIPWLLVFYNELDKRKINFLKKEDFA